MTEGRKDDGGKLRYDLLPPDGLAAIVAVLTYGAAKYAPRNWEAGMDWSRLHAALHRHLAAFQSGEVNDSETGLPHLAHANCCLLFLLCFQLRGIGADDITQSDLRVQWSGQVGAALARFQMTAADAIRIATAEQDAREVLARMDR